MKTTLVSFLMFASFNLWAYPLTTIQNKNELSAYLKKRNYSGVILVAEKGQILMREAFGTRDIESGEKISVEDKFQIGSNTKQMVAMALLKLQDEGKLSIDDPIHKYLDVPPAYDSITIRDVLNHTSGIANYTDVDNGIFWKDLEYTSKLSLENILSFIFKYPLDFSPRSQWKYSNSGYIIAGKILEVVTGMSWHDYLKENIFSPLGMTHTGHSDFFEDVSSVRGHYDDQGTLRKVAPLNLTWALSAGSIYSNVDDLLKWARHYSQPFLLSEKTMEAMLSPNLENYGLGVFVEKTKSEDLYISHGGRTIGFVSKLSQLKARDMTFISLDNNDGLVSGIDNILYDVFVKGSATVIRAERVKLTSTDLSEYAGTFVGEGMEINLYVDDGKLFLFPKGQQPFAMDAIEKDNFDLKFAAEEFIRNDQGQITELKHYQNGHISIFKKQ